MIRQGLASLAVLLACAPAVMAQPSGALDAATLFKRCSPSIVTIESPGRIGSGVIIDASGLIVTNLHVIQGQSEARVTLPGGQTFDAPMVVGVDARRDLAVLKVNGQGLPALTMGDVEALSVGHAVFAIGTPKGLDLTLSQGLLSGVRSRDGDRVLQITAAISSGSSGGALLNDHGQLIGITTFLIEGGQNLNFAMPVTYVRPLMSGAPTTLAATAANYPANPPAGSAKPESDGIPRLSKLYAASNGSMVGFEQNGPALEGTFVNAKGTIYGQTNFTWDAARSLFAGTGAVQTACASADGTPLVVQIKEELLLVDERTIRNRWTRPIMNCMTREAQSYAWDETLWFLLEKQ